MKKKPLRQHTVRRPKDERITKADLREVDFEAGMWMEMTQYHMQRENLVLAMLIPGVLSRDNSLLSVS